MTNRVGKPVADSGEIDESSCWPSFRSSLSPGWKRKCSTAGLTKTFAMISLREFSVGNCPANILRGCIVRRMPVAPQPATATDARESTRLLVSTATIS